MTDRRPERAVLRAAVGEEPLDVAEHAALVEQAAAGAVVTFAGVVRDHDGGRGGARPGVQRPPDRREGRRRGGRRGRRPRARACGRSR